VSTAQKRLLIVDDDPRVCRLVGRLAERHGFAVSHARSLSDIEGASKEAPPALILLDLNLDEIGGADLIESVARLGFLAPIYLLTGADAQAANAAAILGRTLGLRIEGTLHKPLDTDRILRLFASFVDGG